MKIKPATLADIRAALVVLESDTSTTWHSAAADALTHLAGEIRKEIQSQPNPKP